MKDNNRIKQHVLYVGLNDKDTKRQEINTIDAYKIVQRLIVGAGYDGATISEATGIYKHDDGTIVLEKSLQISILFADEAKTEQLINDIKRVLNQESVAFQESYITSELR